MKLLKDYTGQELENLTDEQLEKLVNLECAECGCPFAPDPPERYVPLKPAYDVVLYQVGKSGILVKSQEQAHVIAEYLNGFELWKNEVDWAYGYHAIAKPMDERLEVVRVDAFSMEVISKRKEEMTADKLRKEAYEKANEEYTKLVNRRGNIADSVTKVVYDARQHKWTRERLEDQFRRCVELADGNVDIGFRFFAKAHTHSFYLNFDGTNLVPIYFENPEAVPANG